MPKPKCTDCGKPKECSKLACPMRANLTAAPKGYQHRAILTKAGGGFRTEPTNKE